MNLTLFLHNHHHLIYLNIILFKMPCGKHFSLQNTFNVPGIYCYSECNTPSFNDKHSPQYFQKLIKSLAKFESVLLYNYHNVKRNYFTSNILSWNDSLFLYFFISCRKKKKRYNKRWKINKSPYYLSVFNEVGLCRVWAAIREINRSISLILTELINRSGLWRRSSLSFLVLFVG